MSEANAGAARESIILGSVVVGVGNSAAIRAALDWAVEHVAGDVHVVRVVSPALELVEAGLQIDSSRVDRAKTELDALVGDIAGPQHEMCVHVIEDAVHQALLDVAHRFSVDAIVIGGHGRARVPHLIGAITGRLLHASDVPIVVVPNDWPASRRSAENKSRSEIEDV